MLISKLYSRMPLIVFFWMVVPCQAQLFIDAPFDPAAANAPGRWIGRLPAGSEECPLPPSDDPRCEVRPLFIPAADTNQIPRGLKEYCLYELNELTGEEATGGSVIIIRDSGDPNDLTVTTADTSWPNLVNSPVLAGAINDAMANGTGDPPADPCSLQDLLDGGDLGGLDSDIRAVVPAADPDGGLPAVDPLTELMWRQNRDRFLDRAGRVMIEAVPNRLRVRLAVLDTHFTRRADAAAFTARSPHGHALLNIAEELLCSATPGTGGVCLAEITSRLALPLYLDRDTGEVESDPGFGGEFGTIAGLAESIWDEVVAWQKDGEPGQHLVINLSLGWDPLLGGRESDMGQWPEAVRAVYDALEYASCRGAISIAAAGNTRGGPPEPHADGPWLPAAWEERAAPDYATCLRVLQEAPDPSLFPPNDSAAYRPLVHAVAGVQGNDVPLANASPDSASRLAADSERAVVASRIGVPTASLTGSSVSALKASAAASLVWYHFPEWRADQVMQALYDGGLPLQPPEDSERQAVDFCLDPSSVGCGVEGQELAVRRIHLYGAMGEACNWEPACMPYPITGSPEPVAIPETVAMMTPDVWAAELTGILEHAAICRATEVRYDPVAGLPNVPCPVRQLRTTALEPWTHPAPESVPCPSCGIENGSMFVAIDPEYAGGTLNHATVDACGQIYSLGYPFPLGSITVIHGIGAMGCSQVRMNFTVQTPRGAFSSVANPVQIFSSF